MNEIKRGLFKDHYKNGESKPYEAQENEKFYGAMIGMALFFLFVIVLVIFV